MSKLSLKPGVRLQGLSPQMVLAAVVAFGIYSARGQELVITSGSDGTHGEKSKHYAGNALDLRTSVFGPIRSAEHDATAKQVTEQLQDALGRDFVVLFEVDHIHVQYEPKRPALA